MGLNLVGGSGNAFSEELRMWTSRGWIRSNPARDICMLLPDMLLRTGKMVHEVPRPEEGKPDGLITTRIEVEKAMASLYNFMDVALDPDVKTIMDCAIASGLTSVPPAARTRVLERFCKLLLGTCWLGLRSAVYQGESPWAIQVCARRGRDLLFGFDKMDGLR
jgi:hypothetical protein